MCNDYIDNFITTLHNILLASDLCNGLFSTIKWMNSGRTCLFYKGFWTVYFGPKEKNAVTLPHIAQQKHEFLGEIKQTSKSKKIEPRKKFALELLHHILRHRYTRSSMAVDNANFWKDIELRIDLDPLFTSIQISSINNKSGSKNPLKPKAPFKWGFIDIIPATHPNFLQVRPLFLVIF